MTGTYRLISADSHVNEPPGLWVDRLAPGYRDRAPRIDHFPQGDAWVMEGALDPINFGANCNVGLPAEQRPAWIRWSDVRPGGYDPSARLAEQDTDGVDAEVLYPTPRVSNQLFWHVAEPGFHLACIRAYNDWLSEFCSQDPARLWGVALVPNIGVTEAIAEVRRAQELPAMRGALIGRFPHGDDVISEEDDALWAVLEESGTPVSIHVGFVNGPQGDKARAGKGRASGALRFLDAPIRTVQFIDDGVFDRFPALRLVLVEVDSSWIPYMAEQLDDRFRRAAPASRADIKRLPSEYVGENVLSTFITDRYAVHNRKAIGVTQMMWSSDYPHSGSDWPHSWQTIEDHFHGVPEDEKSAILAGNARRIYGV